MIIAIVNMCDDPHISLIPVRSSLGSVAEDLFGVQKIAASIPNASRLKDHIGSYVKNLCQRF